MEVGQCASAKGLRMGGERREICLDLGVRMTGIETCFRLSSQFVFLSVFFSSIAQRIQRLAST